VALGAGTSHANDTCLEFYWTGSTRSLVERYKPHYLIGQGLADVHMDQIAGMRIRYKWSTQAARCIASTNRYGYFFHPDFDRTACGPDDHCMGTRRRRLTERLTDVLGVTQQLATSNADATYQTNLNTARASTYLVVDAMANAVNTTASFLGSLVADYQRVIDKLALVINVALPPGVRTAVMDELCSPANVAELEELDTQCFEENHFCDLAFLFAHINNCAEYADGATLEQLLADIAQAKTGLEAERSELSAERDQISALWNQIQALRP
jgi:hypothetical protein